MVAYAGAMTLATQDGVSHIAFIDMAERAALSLAHGVISPTHYMLEWLRLRGWRLPSDQQAIPNILDGVPAHAHVGQTSPVNRFVFYGRLETRKGIKLFAQVIDSLKSNAPLNFEVMFVGSNAVVDSMPASEWIHRHTSNWSFPVYKHIDVEPDEARALLKRPGNLIFMCSSVENMPYVVAEAAIAAIPAVICSRGGISEMMDPEHNPGLVRNQSVEYLSTLVGDMIRAGHAPVPLLRPEVADGRSRWLAWHSRFALSSKHDFTRSLLSAQRPILQHSVQEVTVTQQTLASELWDAMCTPAQTATCVLLIPSNYAVLGDNAMLEYACGQMQRLRHLDVVAATFGIKLPHNASIYPSSPSWIAYSGRSEDCSDNVPIMATKDAFCDTYLAHAQGFVQYTSWSYSLMLTRQGLLMATLPTVAFQLLSYTHFGYGCLPNKVPVHRRPTLHPFLSLHSSAEEVMLKAVLGAPRLLASLSLPSSSGWSYGWLQQRRFRPFLRSHLGPLSPYYTWRCRHGQFPFLDTGYQMMHPCVSTAGDCCGMTTAISAIRFTANTLFMTVRLIVEYESRPHCGDGFTILVTHTHHRKLVQEVMKNKYAGNETAAMRESVDVELQMHMHDVIELSVDPHENQDCDGVFLGRLDLWASS
jgi:hypothetical protein